MKMEMAGDVWSKSRNLETIPPTQNALNLHVMRTALQARLRAKNCIS